MKIYRGIISVLFFALAIYVFVLNLVCTCFTTADRFELNYFSGDIFVINIAAIALVIIGAIFSDRIKIRDFISRYFIKIKIILLTLTAVIGVVFVFSCGLGLGVDQLYVQQSVNELKAGVIDSFKPLMYMDMCSNQYGFALVSYIFVLISGANSVTVFRIVNVLLLVLLYSELSIIGGKIGLGKTGQAMILLTGVLFLPTTLYTLFVYGNIGGLALAVLGVRLMITSFEKGKILYGILSWISVFAACLYKTNYMIFVIGIAIYCFFRSIEAKRYKMLIMVPALLAAIWLSSFVPLCVMRQLTGLPLNGGESYMSYIAMGVQENAQNFPGGYNGFNADSYKALNGDVEAHARYSADVYKQIMTEMVSDPVYFLNFFTRKQLHQWADPVYKAYWSVQAVPEHDTAQWFYEMIRPDHAYPVNAAFSYFQLAAWLGAIFFVWFGRKNEHFEEALIMPMIFIGGFIFHTFWEAKSQYTFPYFVILFPVSLLGWRLFKEWFDSRDRTPVKERIDKLSKSKISWTFSFTLAAAAMIVAFVEVLGLGTLRPQFVQDRQMYKDYLSQGYKYSWNPLEDGRYVLSNGTASIECELVNRGDKTYIKETGGSRYLTGAVTGVELGTLEWNEAKNDSSQAFKIYSGDNCIALVYNDDYVFGYEGDIVKVKWAPYGTLVVSELDEGMRWSFTKIS
ncbi:MAG: hypothetical protein J6Z43_04570 [Clostridiales bacterium]|nr:hypothetical protein [Clostridiales bacterium]